MTTRPKKSQGKKSAAGKTAAKTPQAKTQAKKAAAAAASAPSLRKVKTTERPAKTPTKTPSKTPAPVRVNALKPDEKLAEAGPMDAVESIEQSMKAALPAAVAVNCKLVDIAQANVNSGLALARELAGATSPLEMMRLSVMHWHAHMGVVETQAQELRILSATFMTSASEPIRAHLRRI